MNVYLIRAGNRGAIKIGVAVNVARRMATMQTGNAFELKLLATIKCKSRDEAYILEKQLHEKFKRQRIRGEWFQGNIKFRSINEAFVDSDQTISSPTKPKSDYVHIKNAKKKRQAKRRKELCG
jgi:predicted GIY-YIG superfamily endonuclease